MKTIKEILKGGLTLTEMAKKVLPNIESQKTILLTVMFQNYLSNNYTINREIALAQGIPIKDYLDGNFHILCEMDKATFEILYFKLSDDKTISFSVEAEDVIKKRTFVAKTAFSNPATLKEREEQLLNLATEVGNFSNTDLPLPLTNYRHWVAVDKSDLHAKPLEFDDRCMYSILKYLRYEASGRALITNAVAQWDSSYSGLVIQFFGEGEKLITEFILCDTAVCGLSDELLSFYDMVFQGEIKEDHVKTAGNFSFVTKKAVELIQQF